MDKRKKRFWIITGGLAALGLSLLANKMKLLQPVIGVIKGKFGNRINPVTKKADFHNGVDIAAIVGTVVKAPAAGVVEKVYTNPAGGLQMILLLKNGYRTGFAHLSQTLAKVGDRVRKGQEIAKTGKTGRVTGPHLHWTVTNKAGEKVDPLKFVS